MLACDYALRTSLPLLALWLLSGTVICGEEWRGLLPARRGLSTLQSHSPDDGVLPIGAAERLAGWMKEAGLEHEFVRFRGGHGIAPIVLERLSAALRRLG
jgi:phospholipase/carboxylesterase